MDASKKKQLERLIWKDRLRRFLPVVAGVLAFVALLSILPRGSWEASQEVNGTLIALHQPPGEDAGPPEWVVELENGQQRMVPFTARLSFEKGRRVILQEEVHSTHGGTRYRFLRFVEAE
ncbi:MAG: hypothetical protein MI785_03895 [Kiloniellales bacterium]|nr:hypothetical protein [Kiloniellales bacterium]